MGNCLRTEKSAEKSEQPHHNNTENTSLNHSVSPPPPEGKKAEDQHEKQYPSTLFFPDEKLPCKFYLNGSCNRGTQCDYAHSNTNLTVILDILSSAQKSLDVCVFTITLDAFADKIIEMKNKGITIRVITDDEQENTQGSDIGKLKSQGIQVREDSSPTHMHHKFAIIDDQIIINGSYNWTRQATLNNRENVVIIKDKDTIKAFKSEYDHMWNLYGSNSKENTHGKDALSNKNVLFFPDNGLPCRYAKNCNRNNCQFIHEETSLSKLIHFITSAQHSLDICVFTITCNEIASAIKDRHKQGVKVRIITDDDQSKSEGSDIQELISCGVEIRNDNSPFHMHNKFAVIDQKSVSTGSFNYTRQAVLGNRENVMILHQSEFVQPFHNEFEKLWNLFKNNK